MSSSQFCLLTAELCTAGSLQYACAPFNYLLRATQIQPCVIVCIAQEHESSLSHF